MSRTPLPKTEWKKLTDTVRNEFISFSAFIGHVEVRITCRLDDIEIVSRDNQISFDVENDAEKLRDIEFENIY